MVRLNRHFVFLVAVVSFVMVPLGWWIDRCIIVAAAEITGEYTVSGRAQAVVAIALAWVVMLGAIALVVRGSDLTGGRRDPRTDSPRHEEIGQRIHDGPAQMLTFVMLRLDELEDTLGQEGSTQQAARQIIQDVKSASLDALDELRRISRQLA